MKKEKHKWIKKISYITQLSDNKHHYIIKYDECNKCGIQKRRI